MACTGIYDIIILDRMLPYLDGVSLLKAFRRLGHINIYIHYLRKKIKISNLKTVRGVGYYLPKSNITRVAN